MTELVQFDKYIPTHDLAGIAGELLEEKKRLNITGSPDKPNDS